MDQIALIVGAVGTIMAAIMALIMRRRSQAFDQKFGVNSQPD